MFKAIVGIDVSKNSLSTAVITNDKSHQFDVTNNKSGFQKLHKWLKKSSINKAKICMEATGIYGISCADYFYDQGYDVSIVNPACINSFAKSKLSRHKTDKVDSLIIAEYASKYDTRIYSPKDPVMLELKDLYRCLQNIKAQQMQINNFMECKDHLTKEACKCYNRISKYLNKEISNIEQEIDKLLSKNNELKEHVENISTIPGIGKITAIAVLAETPDLSLFKNARELAAFAGLTPKHYSSGISINKQTRISKIGSKTLRQALYFPAISAKKHNPAFKNFINKMKNKGKKAKVIVVAIMRKLLHMIFGIIKNKNQFDPNLYVDI